LVALLTLKLRGDYLAIATFGVASAIQLLANNLEPLTGGSRGLVGLPRPWLALGPGGFALAYAALVFGLLALACIGLRALLRSPWGRLQRALRDDEVACAALGKPVLRHRVESFVLGAVLMGLSGALYAGFVGTASPGDFAPIVTFQIWAMLIVGGSGSLAGAVVGSFVIWALWTMSGVVIVELLPPKWQTQGGALQSLLVGVVLVATLLWRPAGLLGAKAKLAPLPGGGIIRGQAQEET
jgi:branched-chain amino acid transport system permease protein